MSGFLVILSQNHGGGGVLPYLTLSALPHPTQAIGILCGRPTSCQRAPKRTAATNTSFKACENNPETSKLPTSFSSWVQIKTGERSQTTGEYYISAWLFNSILFSCFQLRGTVTKLYRGAQRRYLWPWFQLKVAAENANHLRCLARKALLFECVACRASRSFLLSGSIG